VRRLELCLDLLSVDPSEILWDPFFVEQLELWLDILWVEPLEYWNIGRNLCLWDGWKFGRWICMAPWCGQSRPGDGVNQRDTSEVVVDFGSLSNREDIQQALNYCLKEGIIEELLGVSYKFAHDKLLEAAYSIIPDGKEREQLHLYIGQVLLPNLETDGDYGNEFLIFVVANQLDRGRLQIQCLNDKVELASLNLNIGRRAMELCAFVLASNHCKLLINILHHERTHSKPIL
jgi:hypothetical protein